MTYVAEITRKEIVVHSRPSCPFILVHRDVGISLEHPGYDWPSGPVSDCPHCGRPAGLRRVAAWLARAPAEKAADPRIMCVACGSLRGPNEPPCVCRRDV